MKTKFFRKNHPFSKGRMRMMCLALLLLPLLGRGLGGGCVLMAQNGVKVSDLTVGAGTVTFNVSWNRDAMPVALWSDTVWVFVDYNKNGVMTRLPLSAGATLTATSPGGKVIEEPNNNQGVWVAGNARSAGSFSATVKLLTATPDIAGACAYASNYPPVGRYTSASNIISFTGTPDYKIILERSDKSTYTATVGKDESLLIHSGEVIQSFTDATGAPGKVVCIPSTAYDLKASASSFCAGDAGVTFALSGTQSGRRYQLYRDGTPTAVATLTGTGSAATFTGSMAEGLYTAKILAPVSYCEVAMNGSPVISRNALPAAPTGASANSRCGSGTVTFSASVPSGYTIDWYTASTGTALVSDGGSVTSFSPRLTATTTYHAQARNNTTGCVSATRLPVTGTVNPVPTITRVSGAASQSLNWYTAITPIVYSTTNSAIISRTGGAFPADVTGAPSGTPTGTSYTISGTPSATGTYGYSLTASVNGCTSAASAGTITVSQPATVFRTTTTWQQADRTWSDLVYMATPFCTRVTSMGKNTSTSGPAEYMTNNGSGVTLYYYNHQCALRLCAAPWRLPKALDWLNLIAAVGGSWLTTNWGSRGTMYPPPNNYVDVTWHWGEECINDNCSQIAYRPTTVDFGLSWPYFGFTVRCVK
jgi:hypothetical protein